MNTKNVPPSTELASRPRALAATLKDLITPQYAAYARANQLIQENLLKGIKRGRGVRPKLSLTLDELVRHQKAVEIRRTVQNLLTLLVPLLRKVRAGLQRGESFEPATSGTLRIMGEVLLRHHRHGVQRYARKTTGLMAGNILDCYPDLFPGPQMALREAMAATNRVEDFEARKKALFDKVRGATSLDESELKLLALLFKVGL